MKTKTPTSYLAPSIEIITIAVEQGIAISPNMEKIETVHEEQDW